MLLNLASIIHTPGGIVPFSFSMDFSQSEFGGAYPAQEPVLVSGQVRNEAGVLLLSAEMKTTLHCVCDRCATPFLRDYTQKVSAATRRTKMTGHFCFRAKALILMTS